MARLTIDELYRELEATDEGYIRRKLAIGGYTSAQTKHVQAWLAQRDSERAEQRAARELLASSRTAFWTMVGAFGGVGAALVAIAAIVFARAS
ncbi:TPA: hypothetical protein QDA83_005025 [Burkholderia multivorans]|uniref:hypothetical protein n=1 Tax=Burkholderia TaxID=32008 RepID=UPI0007565508|nr:MULTISPECIES: hypothetical protein [Burkholderia]APY93458.1 hypothetical protein BGI50_11340 [Burkholderia pseudomallei]KVC62855.1 hypothetical protein WI73_24840 [Burkholderia ubonensis]MBO7837762.1 hypothetical protein [Burkholderia pseudomallei]MBU9148114.1 hypothetical protein [Burkholderia multivorans]MBU9305622.1 hypothetical protein [Burkholderia multivorans]